MINSSVQRIPSQEIVLIGGGHAHLEVVRRYSMSPRPYRLTLISADPDTSYSGMLSGLLARHYAYRETHIDLAHLCAAHSVRFIVGRVTDLDPAQQRISIAGRTAAFSYDLVSLDVGSEPCVPIELSGARVVAVKPTERFLAEVETWDAWIDARVAGAPFHVVLIGAGVGGIELALALAQRWRGLVGPKVRLTLCEKSSFIASELPKGARAALQRELIQANIEVLCDAEFIGRDETARDLRLSGGRILKADAVLLATSPRAPSWLQATGIGLDHRGFIRVNAHLQSLSHPNVYAAGDVASFERDAVPLPKAGVYAVRMGPVLAHNLGAQAAGKRLVRFLPQRRFLTLISLGSKRALARWGNFWLRLPGLWALKDAIDRKFMARYQMQPMAVAASSYIEDGDLSEPPCSGCGAKLPQSALDVLPLPSASSAPVVGVAQGDDASVLSLAAGLQAVQSVDGIKAFLEDFERFGRMAMVHALNDIYAMGIKPSSTMVIATVPFGPRLQMQRDLGAMMQGVAGLCQKDGVTLLGGHSQAGLEASLGVLVQGFAQCHLGQPERPLWTKGVARGELVIVLTKPLGTGVLLAGHMRRVVASRDLYAAFATMEQSHAAAFEVLKSFPVQTATDITGFGLARHLQDVANCSQVVIDLDLTALPFYPGALAAARAGVRTSLWRENSQGFRDLMAHVPENLQLQRELLFDPQTSGGLAVFLPLSEGFALVDRLKAAGYPDACCIGRTTSYDGELGAESTQSVRLKPSSDQRRRVDVRGEQA